MRHHPEISGRAHHIRTPNAKHERIIIMLYTIAVVLIILWLLGLVSSYTMGGLIHVLLVIAIVVILLRVISGRNRL
jgi:Family of unknown function (DUF5670)